MLSCIIGDDPWYHPRYSPARGDNDSYLQEITPDTIVFIRRMSRNVRECHLYEKIRVSYQLTTQSFYKREGQGHL